MTRWNELTQEIAAMTVSLLSGHCVVFQNTIGLEILSMQSDIDKAISEVSAREATYTGDQDNITLIKANIATATQPLDGANNKLISDSVPYKASLLALAALATSQANAIADPPPDFVPTPDTTTTTTAAP